MRSFPKIIITSGFSIFNENASSFYVGGVSHVRSLNSHRPRHDRPCRRPLHRKRRQPSAGVTDGPHRICRQFFTHQPKVKKPALHRQDGPNKENVLYKLLQQDKYITSSLLNAPIFQGGIFYALTKWIRQRL